MKTVVETKRESLSSFITDSMIRDFVLEVYDPGCRYLRDVQVNLPEALGIFKADFTFVTKKKMDIGHFSAFENVMCFNQLGFVLYARALMDGYFSEFPPLTMEQLLAYQKNSVYILSINKINYNRAFLASDEFEGKLTIGDYEYKPEKNLILAHTDFDFANGKATGNITVALKVRPIDEKGNVAA